MGEEKKDQYRINSVTKVGKDLWLMNARMQLLSVAQAQNQDWSHLIFAGWNERVWPPPASTEFARAEEIRAFNRSVQQLNKRAARQGRNPQTGDTIKIKASKNPAFKAGKALKDAVN